MGDASVGVWAAVWPVVAAVVLGRHWRKGLGAGLVFTYILSFGALHWLAAGLYLLPWYDSSRLELTALGLRESAVAVIAFAAGSEVVLSLLRPQRAVADEALMIPGVDNRVVNLYFITGAVLYVAVFPVAGRLPSATALVATGSTLGIVAIGLKCWNAWSSRNWIVLWLWLAGTVLLPVITVVGQGFLGYGFAAMLTVLAFVASFYRPRWQVVVVGLLMSYAALSVYVTYMRDRQDIRAVVWSGAVVEDRMQQLVTTFNTTEWFDPWSEDHLDRIEVRLNQNYLIGASIAYLTSGAGQFAHGATLAAALVAIVPRAIWPDKPTVGGSGDLVSDFTGFRFAEGTSVGIGQVMEAYVNFGRWGVVIVFFVIGGLLSLIDRQAFLRLKAGRGSQFVLWYLPGLSLLQVGGSLSEVTSTAAAALLVAVLLNRLAQAAYPDRRMGVRAADPSLDQTGPPEVRA